MFVDLEPVLLARDRTQTRQRCWFPLRKTVKHMILLPVFSTTSPRRSVRRGHAIVLTLLILLVTAAVAFGVLSIGRHARVKEMTHFSAQAGAESGASWIARSLNTVAMNNNAMARLIVQAGIVEGTPTAVEMYQKDLKAIDDVMKTIDVKDLPRDWQPIDNANPINMAFENFKHDNSAELRATTNALSYIRKQVKDEDLAMITHVQPTPDSKEPGIIWQAINAMDDINQAVLENLEVQTQLSVLRGSILDTTARQTEASAFMLPTSTPLVPWKRGTFSDFAPVIQEDHEYQISSMYMEYIYNNNIEMLRQMTVQVPEKFKVPRNKSGKCPVSQVRAVLSMSRPNTTRMHTDPNATEIGQMTQPATRDQAVLKTIGTLLYRLKNQRIVEQIDAISKHYVNQLWPDEKHPVKPIHDSQWITDPDKIYEIMDKNPKSIVEIAFVTLQIKSAFAPTDPKFRSEGSWVMLDQKNEASLNVEYFPYNAQMDPRTWNKLDMEQIHPRMWRENWTYQAHSDRTINLKGLPPDEKNKYPKQLVYRLDDYLLVGINVGKELKLDSPYNFPNNASKPAPILYVTDESNPKASDRIKRTVVAQNHVRSLPWSTPVAPTEMASPMLAPYNLLVDNMDNKSLWFQGWSGRAVADDTPTLTDAVSTDELQPLVSGKLFESVLTELKERVAQAKQEETEVP